MLINFFLHQIFSIQEITNSQELTLQKCSPTSIIRINSFGITGKGYPGSLISLKFKASLEGKIENPFLDIQLYKKGYHIPIIRFHDDLCRPTILQCPATFSNINYINQITLPSHAEPGAYQLLLIFREGTKILACFETLFRINERNS